MFYCENIGEGDLEITALYFYLPFIQHPNFFGNKINADRESL